MFAPDALMVVEVPLQSVVCVALAETVGNGFIVNTTLPVFEQPAALVPVTVYVVVEVGLAEKEAPAPDGFQV